MNSIEKITELCEQLSAPPPPDAAPLELTARTIFMTFGPKVLSEFLPQDPADLDNFLTWFAIKVLEARSDDVGHALTEAVIESTAELDA